MYGKATDGTLDLDDQIVDPGWAKEALGDWFKAAANVRQMHSPHIPPAGKGVELTHDDDGTWLTSKVIEPGAQKLVDEGVYTGYSVGIKNPRVIRDTVAKNGRIVGGSIVEVSLVDYPANPSCKFALLKMADSGAVEYVGKSLDVKCACGCACTGTTADPSCTCPCATCSAVRGGTAKRVFSDEHRQRAAAAGHAMPDGSFPIETTGDLDNAVQAVGRATDYDAVKEHITRRAKELGATDQLPAHWEGSTKEKPKAALKRLHDALCPAFDPLDVVFAHPEIAKNGLAGTVGPEAAALVFQLLQHELEEDGGKGSEAWDICNLASIYSSIINFVQSEAYESVREALLREVVADQYKSFAAEFPDVRLSPDDVQPTDFRRGYLAAGHQRASAAPAPPTTSRPPNAPTADHFDRTGAIPGEERPSPGNQPTNRPSSAAAARTFYSNAARDQVRAALRNIHDSLAAIDDQICPLLPAGANAKVPTNQDATPTPVHLAATPDLTKRDDNPDLGAVIDKAVRSALADEQARHSEEITKLNGEVAALHTSLRELGQQPDPRTVAYRGPALDRPSAARPAGRDDAEERALKAQMALRIETLRKMLGSTEPGVARYAEEQIGKLAAT